jgi:uridine kinase
MRWDDFQNEHLNAALRIEHDFAAGYLFEFIDHMDEWKASRDMASFTREADDMIEKWREFRTREMNDWLAMNTTATGLARV